MVSVTKVKGSALVILCVLLSGSRCDGPETQLALASYNPNIQGSLYKSVFDVIVNIQNIHRLIQFPSFKKSS